MNTLTEPWTHEFMQRALLELVLVGVVGGVLGCWVGYYQLAYSAESLAHALFPGLVGAALLGLPLIFGATVGLLLAAVGVAVAGRIPAIGHDTAVAVVVTSLFGLGVVLALSPTSPPGIGELLFGDPLAVTSGDLIRTAVLAAAALGALAALHRQLLAVGFDRSAAHALGASPLVADLSLLGLIALATLIGVQALGNLLVVAVVIGPAAIARLLFRRLVPMMILAALLAVLSAFAGLYFSYYASTAGGASIAAVIVATYLLVLVIRSGKPMRRRARWTQLPLGWTGPAA
jgi:ABC-type Mn2+/Zn2+ transport system permease subunit